MTSLGNQSGIVVFSIIGALIIVGSAWFTQDSESNDAWLYVFSIWMILFSAFQVRTTVPPSKIPKIVFCILAGASVIIVVTWWANGAENAWIFLTSVVAMLVAFLILVPRK